MTEAHAIERAEFIHFIRQVIVRTKHGPLGKGGAGPCSTLCLKCTAEAKLKELLK